jgi:capsular exopolysaccharide synthesis family protein
VVSKIFGIQSQPGLTDVILGNYEWRKVVRSITDIMMGKMTMEEIMMTPGLDNLSIMTCGTIAPNPAELVSTQVNADFLKESHEEYDFVIIDAPPVLAATDAAIWGTKADGIILVYQVGKVARGALKRAKAQIDNVKARIIGVVLNGLKAEISPDFEYHDKYYSYYGSDRKKKPTLGEKILSCPERIKQYSKNFPGNLKTSLKDKGKRKLPADFKSGLIKLLFLLLAIALLIAGIYYQRVVPVPKPLKVPFKLGDSAVMVPPLEGDRKTGGLVAETTTALVFPTSSTPLPPGAVLLIWEGEPSAQQRTRTDAEETVETYPARTIHQVAETVVLISNK